MSEEVANVSRRKHGVLEGVVVAMNEYDHFFSVSPGDSPTNLRLQGCDRVTVLTPLLTARAVAVEDGSAHARWLGRRWVGGWFFGGCSRRRLSRREGTAAQATALVGSCGAGRFARAAAMRRPA